MAYTTINNPTDYFNTVLYTGNGGTNAITGVGFQPDLVWLKERSSTSNHQLGDAVRGATKYIQPNTTDNELTDSNRFSSFDSDGFTQGANNGVNESGQTYVAWNWLADNTSGSSNTDGSITSTVSANTTAGFSIVSYTGTGANATVGHGLGVAPSMIIVKNRSIVENWEVYHQSLGNGTAIRLNLTDASFSTSGRWNNTSPTSSVFSLGTANVVNGSGNNLIAYCFVEKKGFSKIGSYKGNGDADGAFVYTGFKPAWLMIKSSTEASRNWLIYDNKRETFNEQEYFMRPNSNGVEARDDGYSEIDLLSNGFKLRGVSGDTNNSNTFIYMAFAEHPFVSSTGTPVTAR